MWNRLRPIKRSTSSVFKDPFIIRALTSKEMDNVRKAATRKVRNRAGVMTAETDQDKFSDGLIVAALVSPDPNNAQLQESWDTVADPAGTIKTCCWPVNMSN